jgi:hypothetical protein
MHLQPGVMDEKIIFIKGQVIRSCDNEIDSLSSIKHQCLALSVRGEHIAMIVVGNSKQRIKVIHTLAFHSLVKKKTVMVFSFVLSFSL